MSIGDLVHELTTIRDFDLPKVRAKVQSELDAAASSEQRGRILEIFSKTLDQAERNLGARGDQEELLEKPM